MLSIKMRERHNKKTMIGSFNFAQPKSESGNRSKFFLTSSVPAPSLASAPVPNFRNSNSNSSPGSKYQGSVSSTQTNPLCQTSGRNHKGAYRIGGDICFGYGKFGHRVRNCPQSGSQGQYNRLSDQSSHLNQQVPLPVPPVNIRTDFTHSSSDIIRKFITVQLRVRYRPFIYIFMLYQTLEFLFLL